MISYTASYIFVSLGGAESHQLAFGATKVGKKERDQKRRLYLIGISGVWV